MWPLKRSNPSDLEILEAIQERVRDRFPVYDMQREEHDFTSYVPVDLEAVAGDLGVNVHIVFGRLYYDLDHRYRYEQPGGSKVHLFSLKVGDMMHCIHAPYLSSVVADLRGEWNKYLTSVGISLFSLGVAAAALFA